MEIFIALLFCTGVLFLSVLLCYGYLTLFNIKSIILVSVLGSLSAFGIVALMIMFSNMSMQRLTEDLHNGNAIIEEQYTINDKGDTLSVEVTYSYIKKKI